MDVNELLTGLDRKLAETEDWIDQLRTELVEAEKTVNDLRREAAAVRSAVRRFAGSAAAGEAVEAADPTWLHLSQVDAVERAVRDAGPLHLQDIVDLLAAKGRRRPTKATVSANLTHLGQTRHSVVNIGKGRWDYVRAAPTLRVVTAEEKLPGGEPTLVAPAVPAMPTGRTVD